MGKKKVVLDTNILISALGWQGKPKEVFRKCVSGEIELCISLQQLDELKRVMEYPKFSFTQEQKERFLGIILKIATIVKTAGIIKVIEEDPDDNDIIETAVVGNAEFIISGDPHLLKLKHYSSIKIITASEFVEME